VTNRARPGCAASHETAVSLAQLASAFVMIFTLLYGVSAWMRVRDTTSQDLEYSLYGSQRWGWGSSPFATISVVAGAGFATCLLRIPRKCSS